KPAARPGPRAGPPADAELPAKLAAKPQPARRAAHARPARHAGSAKHANRLPQHQPEAAATMRQGNHLSKTALMNLAALALSFACGAPALADPILSRPITIMIGLPPGGG